MILRQFLHLVVTLRLAGAALSENKLQQENVEAFHQ